MSKVKTAQLPRHYSDLENDLKPEVVSAIALLTVEPLRAPAEVMSPEELEREILSLSELHFKAAKLKRKGYGYAKISELLSIPAFTVKRMVERYLNLSYRMMPVHMEELRQEVIGQLDDMLLGLYNNATSLGRENLTSQEVDTALRILDRKIKMLGIEPPQEVKMTISQEIVQAKSQLDKIMSNYEIIDVTPKDIGVQDDIELE